MPVVATRLPEWLLEKLDEYAAKVGISRSEAVRRAILLLVAGGSGEGLEKLYRCPVCGRLFRLRELRRHILAHVETRDGYQCPLCGKTFPTISRLAQHARQMGLKHGDRSHLALWALLPTEKRRHTRPEARHIIEQLAVYKVTHNADRREEQAQE